MRKPLVDISIFKQRRDTLSSHFGDGALVLFSSPEYIRNNDVHHPYRQDSNFFYMTGFEEPGAIFIFRPGKSPETTLFVRPKDQLMETWEGFRFGVQMAGEAFGIDACYEVDQFEDEAPKLLQEVETVYHNLFVNSNIDQQMQSVLKTTRSLQGRSGRGLLSVKDPYSIIGEARLVKSDFEIETMKKACEISADGHIAMMRAMKPGINERAIQGVFIGEIMSQGSAREGYGTIVASGSSATTLHYVFNDQPCRSGDLVLIDAGAEYNYYSGDITRTFPVNGRFSDLQKRVYNKVLKAQKKLISMIKPGVTQAAVHDSSVQMLTEIMIEEGLLQGTVQENINNLNFKKYYPHGIGHWLGMDVHDSGLYTIDGKPRPFEAGMCLTIEPGLYVPADDMSAPQELRGLGIRIEDNILITPMGHENLTKKAPKEVEEIESLMAQL